MSKQSVNIKSELTIDENSNIECNYTIKGNITDLALVIQDVINKVRLKKEEAFPPFQWDEPIIGKKPKKPSENEVKE